MLVQQLPFPMTGAHAPSVCVTYESVLASCW